MFVPLLVYGMHCATLALYHLGGLTWSTMFVLHFLGGIPVVQQEHFELLIRYCCHFTIPTVVGLIHGRMSKGEKTTKKPQIQTKTRFSKLSRLHLMIEIPRLN